MANRTAALLTQLFKYAVHRRMVSVSPMQLLFRPGGKEEMPRQRTLSDAELSAFLKHPQFCTPYERLQHVIVMLLATGCRRGELAQARWSDIDMKGGLWTVLAQHTKSQRGSQGRTGAGAAADRPP
jgi:integrase